MLSLLFCALFHLCLVHAAFDLGFGEDTDLTHFVTRPEIRVPILNVTWLDRDAAVPGKWFVAAYAEIQQQPHPRKYYQACQTGPVIYDFDGVCQTITRPLDLADSSAGTDLEWCLYGYERASC
jgi:hypothetical protein